jgi:CheY-like chemotaxis protein
MISSDLLPCTFQTCAGTAANDNPSREGMSTLSHEPEGFMFSGCDETIDQCATRQALTQEKDAWSSLYGSALVVDDCSHARNSISRVLRSAGLRVETAENGQVACQMALATAKAGRPFDLILTDMDMPVMDGYAATAHLRESGYCGRIIALTASSDEDAREQCYIVGCDDFATKPITLDALLEIAKRNLQTVRSLVSLAEARKAVSASRVRPLPTPSCA